MAESGGGGVLRELLAVFSFGVDDKELKKGENALSGFLDKVKSAAEALAGAFAINEIKEWAENNVKAMADIEHASQRLGISTDKVQQFQFAAKGLGLDGDALTRSMGRLQVSASNAASGSKQAAHSFETMGISVRDSNGHVKTADELMLDVADGIKNTADSSKQAALATQLFGRSGRELLPFLKEGRAGFSEIAAAYKELGGGFSEKAIEQTKKFEKQEARTSLATTGLKNSIMVQLLPIMESLSKVAEGAVKWFGSLINNSHLLEAAMYVLGGVASVFAIKMAIAFAPLVLAAAGIALLIALVDDFMGLLEGKKSLIGEVLGTNTDPSKLEKVRAIWKDIKDFVSDIASKWDSIKGVIGAAQTETAKGLVQETGFVGSTRAGIDRLMGRKTFKQNLLEDIGSKNAAAITDARLTGQQPKLLGGPGLSMAEVAQATGFAVGSGIRTPYFGPDRDPGDITVNVAVPPNMATQEAAHHIGREVRKAISQETRSAHSKLQRAPQTAK